MPLASPPHSDVLVSAIETKLRRKKKKSGDRETCSVAILFYFILFFRGRRLFFFFSDRQPSQPHILVNNNCPALKPAPIDPACSAASTGPRGVL
jgi:hypothetical protein